MSKSTVCYLYNKQTNENIRRFDDLASAQREKHKLNRKEGKTIYGCRVSWAIIK